MLRLGLASQALSRCERGWPGVVDSSWVLTVFNDVKNIDYQIKMEMPSVLFIVICKYLRTSYWATRGVTVSESAFLACHQCCCAGSSLTLGLASSGFSMRHFLKLVARGFIRVLRFPRFNGSANKIKLK